MFNCVRVFRNGYLFAVVKNEFTAETMIQVYTTLHKNSAYHDRVDNWRIEPTYIEGIGF